MLDKATIKEQIEERMKNLDFSDTCALFLLSVEETGEEGEEGKKTEDLPEREAWVEGLLARFFRISEDIVGCLDDGRFIAFLSGRLTESVVWEKARTLSEALWFAAEDLPSAGQVCGCVGVYMFRANGESFSFVFRKAEYALEMARQNASHHFYIYVASNSQPDQMQPPFASSQMLLNYIDEGVRILEVGNEVRAVYVSPGYYRRLAVAGGTDSVQQIRIHPSDRDIYEADVRRAARSAEVTESRYRVSRDGTNWIFCRIRLLRLTLSGDLPIVLEISHNITGLEQLKSQNDENREWLRYVVGQTDYQLWEADLKSRTFRLLHTPNIQEGRQTVYENFPESLVDSGRVHQDSAVRFRRFAEDMLNGKADDSENFVIQYRQSSCYGWASMSYHMLYDEEGHPEKAIGIKEDLSYLPVQRCGYIQRRIMPADLYPHLYGFLQANLTRDQVEKLQLEGRDQNSLMGEKTYTEIIGQGLLRIFSTDDGKRLQARLERLLLLEEFRQGRRWLYEKCRIIDSQGEIQWIVAGVNLDADPETGDVCLFAYLSRENQRRKWESELNEAVAADPETGVYDTGAFRLLVQHLFGQEKEESCALAEIGIVGFDEFFSEEDPRGRDILTALNVFLDTDCVVGKTKERGRLQVFFPHMASKPLLQREIENAFSFVRISLNGMEEMKYLRLVAAVACGERENSFLGEMAAAASGLCSLHTGEAADTVVFCEGQGDYQRSIIDLKGRTEDELSFASPEPAQDMTEEEKDIALKCEGLMLRAGSADSSVNAVLARIGAYYQADRVYILALTEQGRIITMINEWTGKGKFSIQYSLSGKNVDRFPVIARFVRNPSPLFLSMKEKWEERDGEGVKTPWQYAILPMEKAEETEQMLCIENPRRSLERTALLDQLIPYLSRERSRFSSQKREASPLDRLYSIPNLQTYMNVIYSLDSDMNSSLGVMAVDIPDFALLKEEKGYEYGTRFLLRLSEVLLDVFGRSLLFHTKEAEFIVLCTDMTYETFLNQCARVRQLVDRKYAGMFRTGCTWSGGIFDARDLVQKARSLMRCAGPSELFDLAEPAGAKEMVQSSSLHAVTKDIDRFTIYLQPKVDIRSGSLTGVEALVRILDGEGGLLSHSRVIEEMENRGTIQDLDYFVLDRTLHVMSGWKEKGYPLIPVSSNFSRNTILSPSALASVLAVFSRYPDISQEMLEIEITETAGDFENNTFAEMLRRFGEYGLQLSLDDFGSSYSNMSMLANLHFHSVKLDRSMIRSIADNPVSQMMVQDLVKLCDKCGMLCIAEGVETKPQAEALLRAGCRYAQGFYYGRPMPVEEFEQKYFQN